MVNDYSYMRSVLDMENPDDKIMAIVLTSLQQDEVNSDDLSAPELEEEYVPETIEGPPPDTAGTGSQPPGGSPGNDPVCPQIFLSVEPKGRVPEPRMARQQVFVKGIWKNGNVALFPVDGGGEKRPEELDSKRQGYFWKTVSIDLRPGENLLYGISYGDWISSYSTNPENIHLDFFINEVGQRFVNNPSSTTVKMIYILGVEKSLSALMKHGKGSQTEVPKGISLQDLKNSPGYEEEMDRLYIDNELRKKIKEFINTDPNPPKQDIDDYADWINEHWNWFWFSKDPNGKKNNPCKYQSDKQINTMMKQGDNTFNPMKMRQGACRHKSTGFFVMAIYHGIPCRVIGSDCHAFIELWVPGIGWNMYDLGGCSPPGSGDDEPLDPSKPFQETTDAPSDPPDAPNDPKNGPEASLIIKQMNAIVKRCKDEGLNIDISALLEALHEDMNVNKKKRFF